MKKLFLRDAKLMYGSSLEDQNAVEVVNHGLPTGGPSTRMVNGRLYDLPKGWTVEILDQFRAVAVNNVWFNFKDYNVDLMEAQQLADEGRTRKVAALIPTPEKQAANALEIKLSKQAEILCGQHLKHVFVLESFKEKQRIYLEIAFQQGSILTANLYEQKAAIPPPSQAEGESQFAMLEEIITNYNDARLFNNETTRSFIEAELEKFTITRKTKP